MSTKRTRLARAEPPAGQVQMAFGYRTRAGSRAEVAGIVPRDVAEKAFALLVEGARRISRGEPAP